MKATHDTVRAARYTRKAAAVNAAIAANHWASPLSSVPSRGASWQVMNGRVPGTYVVCTLDASSTVTFLEAG